MHSLHLKTVTRLTVIETRLMLREASPPLFTVLLPVALLLIFGWSPGTRVADPALGGHRAIDTVIPSMSVMVSLAMVAFFMLPVVLASYREKGILRRFATTPVRPSAMLGAQVLMNGAVVAVSTLLTLVVGVALLDMLVAAAAGTAKTATGWALGLWFPSAFFAGLYVPVEHLPAVLRRIGDCTPLGAFRQAIQAAWVGDVPDPLHLAVLAATFLIAGGLSIRLYRAS